MASKPRNVRVRKLATRTAIAIYREDEVESDEYEVALSQLAKVSTGVESNEETEFHLQAIISDTLQKDKEIPTGEKARPSNIKYDELYPPNFKTSQQYIAFSQTVEDCTGCQYDMSTEDADYLKSFNKSRPRGPRLSEDDFEKLMEAYEEYAATQTPFASVDNTVSPWAEVKEYLEQELGEKLQTFAKDVYEYWRVKKQAADRGHIQPCLKLETQQTQQDNDDNDAYICFRRREVRQTRKTRARDQQSTERLRNLRKNLDEGRTVTMISIDRDKQALAILELDSQIFDQRGEFKEVKTILDIKTGEDLLVNQRPQKRKAAEVPQMQRPPPGSIKYPSRGDGRPFDAEFQLLSERNADKENKLQALVSERIKDHEKYNEGWVDCSREPLSLVQEQGVEKFRPATVSYILTPPNSASEESMVDHPMGDHPSPMEYRPEFTTVAMSAEDPRSRQTYRRRIGRGNRLWIDRRGMSSAAKNLEVNDRVADRMKFDQDDDDEPSVYYIDPYSFDQMKFRTTIPISQHFPPQRRAVPPPGNHIPSGSQASPARPGPAPQRQQQQSISSVT